MLLLSAIQQKGRFIKHIMLYPYLPPSLDLLSCYMWLFLKLKMIRKDKCFEYIQDIEIITTLHPFKTLKQPQHFTHRHSSKRTSRTGSEGAKNDGIRVFQVKRCILRVINGNAFFTIINLLDLNTHFVFQSYLICLPEPV